MQKSMKHSAILFGSLLILVVLSACAHAPKPPVGNLCGINAQSSYILCFDFQKDFDENGKLKPDSKGVRTPITLMDLHKGWFMTPDSKESLQGYALKWKERFKELQKNCQ